MVTDSGRRLRSIGLADLPAGPADPAGVAAVEPNEGGFGVELLDRSVEEVGRADEVGDEAGRRPVVELLRGAELLDPTAVHHRDPVAHRQRLLLVVGHVDERDPDLGLDPLELELEALAELEVERPEGLVEEEHVGAVDEGPGEGDPLLLAARQLVRLALLVAGQVDELERLAAPAGDLGLLDPLALEAEGDVVADVEVGEQGVVLEDHVDRPLVGRVVGHVAAAQLDPAARRQLETADHPQGRRLAAARRSEEREEFAGLDVEVDRIDRPHLAKVLGEVDEPDLGGLLGCARHRCGRA